MPQPKSNPEDIKRAFVSLAFDEAYKIREELYGNEEDGTPGVFTRRKENREQLRSLAKQGFLSPEEREELAELYPARQTKAQEEEENAAAAPEPAAAAA